MVRHERFVAVAFSLLMVMSVSAAAQAPPVLPRIMLRTLMTAVNLTDDQRSTIAAIVADHKEAIQSARSAQDPIALRTTMREVMQQVINVLTPEQREAAKTAVKDALATERPVAK